MYLGLDLGTSGLKAVLMDEGGAVLASADADYPVAHPAPGWSEQAPDDWITGCERAVGQLAEDHPRALAAVRGIGLSGQMHGAVCLGPDDRPLRPAILWNDTRAHQEAGELDAAQGVRDLSGNIVFPGFTAPKLVWLARHEPETFAAIRTVLLPKDYLRLWLTGGKVSEMSDAAGTVWLDVGARDWSQRLLDASGMRADRMPALVEGSAPSGQLRGELARRWGMTGPVTVAGGGGDNAAAACGTGALAEGQGFVSLGTSGVVLLARDSYAPAPETAVHTFCHAVPGTWYQMGVMLAATDCLNWLSAVTGTKPATLTGELGEAPAAPARLVFLPYLSGERTPHNDSRIRGGFLNVDIGHGRADLTRAVLEGVSFGLRDSLEALRGAGARPARLLAIGGGAASEYWLRLLASVLNLPLDVPAGGAHGAALGAARLGRIAATGEAPEAVLTSPAIARTVAPDPGLAEACEAAYARFKNLYPAVKELP